LGSIAPFPWAQGKSPGAASPLDAPGFGLWAPNGTAPEVVARLTGATMEALADPAVRQRLADLGQEIPPPESQTAAALAAHLKAELEKWTPIIKDANIKVE
jgi:tripartite-type tricarboxylate transporter receptor subunit TctC